MNFTDVLKELMIDKNIDIKTLAKETGIYISSLYYYFEYYTIPDIKRAILLSDYFECSISYLLGLSDQKTIKKSKQNKSFIDNYNFLLKINKTNNYKVSKELNINRNSIYNWKKGQTPKMNILIEFAKYFDTSIDFLIGRTDEF